MLLTKYNPNNTFPSLLDEFMKFDNFFDDFNIKTTNSIPYDIIEDDKKYIIDLMIAGYDKENLNVEVDDGKITITGERFTNENLKYSHKNSYFGKFKKSFTLPKYVIIDKIGVEYTNGVLKIEIPKDEKSISTKKIEVK